MAGEADALTRAVQDFENSAGHARRVYLTPEFARELALDTFPALGTLTHFRGCEVVVDREPEVARILDTLEWVVESMMNPNHYLERYRLIGRGGRAATAYELSFDGLDFQRPEELRRALPGILYEGARHCARLAAQEGRVPPDEPTRSQRFNPEGLAERLLSSLVRSHGSVLDRFWYDEAASFSADALNAIMNSPMAPRGAITGRAIGAVSAGTSRPTVPPRTLTATEMRLMMERMYIADNPPHRVANSEAQIQDFLRVTDPLGPSSRRPWVVHAPQGQSNLSSPADAPPPSQS